MSRNSALDYVKLSDWLNNNRNRLLEQRSTLAEIKKLIEDELKISFGQKTISDFKTELGIIYPEEQLKVERNKQLESLKEDIVVLQLTCTDIIDRLTKLENPDNN